jgi:iron complex outermembrane receptor protein
MVLRAAVVLVSLLALPSLHAQFCSQVIDASDQRSVPGSIVLDANGKLLNDTDRYGRFCLLPPLPMAITIQAQGFHARRIELNGTLPDTLHLRPLRVDLAEVRITPDPQRSLGTALITATTLDSSLLQGFERASINSAMQWVPGVQMDQRGHGGSTRLSIRGSLLRSPFGVRGVKVYWGGLPMTLADGSTPLELLDPEVVGTLQVVRSIGPPAYGSAPSGLLLVQPPWPTDGDGLSLNASVSGGSFGFQRIAATAGLSADNDALVVGAVHQRNAGFRDQESSARDQVFLLSRHQRGRTKMQASVTLQQASWQLPGGLDSATAATAPRSANAFSQRIDARLEKRQVLAGLVMEHELGKGVQLLATVHGQIIDKLNPFGTSPAFSGYKEEDIRAAGSRLALASEQRLGRWSLGTLLGTEVLAQRDELDERVFVNAVPDTFRLRADTRVRCVNLYSEVRLSGPKGTELFAAVGMERNAHEHRDLLNETTVSTDRPADLHPVLGLSQRIATRWWATLRHGSAVSRPTVWELLGSTGAFATELAPEVVRETELSISHGAPGDRLQIQAAGYLRETRGLILPTPSAQGTGNDFVNAGTAAQRGVEAYLHWHASTRPGRGLSILTTLTLQDHEVARDDRSDVLRVPGVPDAVAGIILRYQGPVGLGLEWGVRYVAAVPVGPFAEGSLPAYQVMHLRGEWRKSLGSRNLLTAFVHVENLTDVAYTSFVQASDPLGRYYNPAPARSVFVGLRFQRQSSGE